MVIDAFPVGEESREDSERAEDENLSVTRER